MQNPQGENKLGLSEVQEGGQCGWGPVGEE